LCFWCLEGAEHDVRGLPLDYYGLEQLLPVSLSQRGTGLPTGRGGLPHPPIAEHVLDLQIDIFRLTDAWDDVVRDLDRLSDKPTRTRAGWAVQQSVSILAPRLARLALAVGTMWDYPGAVERCTEVPGWQGVLDLARLHHRARHVLGLTRVEPELCQAVPCKACDAAALYRVPGDDTVRCGRCSLVYSAKDYAEWTALLAASVERDRAA
jgi:hypothetical protein